MSTYYVDPAATGAADGSSWADAWTDLQIAVDTAVAGGIIYCRGIQTLTTQIDIDTNSGNYTSGYIKIIGCNESGDNDGTRFVLDGNSAATFCLNFSGREYIILENIECKNATSHGIDDGSSANNYIYFINCSFHDNGGSGVIIYYIRYSVFFRCAFYNNTSDGVTDVNIGMIFLFCSIHDNGSHGIDAYAGYDALIYGCLIYDNSGNGVYQGSPAILHCVINGNADDGIVSISSAYSRRSKILFNRITNHPTGKYGINFNGQLMIHGWNYLEDNAAGNYANNTIDYELLYNGSGTNDEDNADTNEGYTSKTDGSEDFNLTTSASMRRTAIVIPLI